MALTKEAVEKLEKLPADKMQLLLALADEFLAASPAEDAFAGRVLSQTEIDALVKNIQASMK